MAVLIKLWEFAELIKKIKLIKNWHEIHQEFYCDIIGTGKDAKDNITLNFYFMLKKD